MFVANCMTKNPITIAPDVGIDEAAKIMDKGHFRRLPVVEHGKLLYKPRPPARLAFGGDHARPL